MRKHLPVLHESILDDIGVATPCDADWERMSGDDRVRHCPACRLNVYNLSAMTRAEATALVAAREGRLCVRLYRRLDGTLITQNCRDRLRAARKRGIAAFAVALVIVCVTQLGLRIFAVRALLEWYQDREAQSVMMGAMPMPLAPPVKPGPKQQAVNGGMVLGMPSWREPPEPDPKARAKRQKVAKPALAPQHEVQGKMIMGDIDY